MVNNNRKKGSEYEKIAADFLINNGLDIVQFNYVSKRSEIDIIARDKDTLVFVEVKYRTDSSYGYPFEAVDIKKKQRIKNGAKYYLIEKNLYDEVACRFDVISILGKEIIWIKDAF